MAEPPPPAGPPVPPREPAPTREEVLTRSAARDVFPWLVAALFAALAILAGVLWWNAKHDLDKTAKVPGVTHSQRTDAEARLRARGFDVKVNLETNQLPAGEVIEQAPGGGTRLTKHALVYLAVSRGAAVIPVPKVTGIRIAAARRVLTALKLQPEATVVPSTQPKDIVLTQTPPAGDKVSRGTVVTMRVSAGPRLVAVPAVRGLTREKALAALSKVGLVGVETPVPSEEAEGIVVAQNPPRGQKVRFGSRVRLNVSTGPGTTSTTATGTTATVTVVTVTRSTTTTP